jgi:transposase, IS5 family
VRRFVGIDLINASGAGCHHVLKFRRLFERHDMPARIFALIREQLSQQEIPDE